MVTIGITVDIQAEDSKIYLEASGRMTPVAVG